MSAVMLVWSMPTWLPALGATLLVIAGVLIGIGVERAPGRHAQTLCWLGVAVYLAVMVAVIAIPEWRA
jgi:hypothetical protein